MSLAQCRQPAIACLGVQDAIIEEAKNKGQYEHGIVNLQAQSINTISRELLHVDPSSGICQSPPAMCLHCCEADRLDFDACLFSVTGKSAI